MDPNKELAKLCKWCKQINFAAILTPREWDLDSGKPVATFKPEYNGNGETPSLEWTHFGPTKRTGPPENYLPQIRVARYEDLSDSDDETGATRSGKRKGKAKGIDSADVKGKGKATAATTAEEETDSHKGNAAFLGDDSDSSEAEEDNDEKDGGESVSTWSGTSHFTEIQQIDLEMQRNGALGYEDGHLYHLGSIWDVRSRRHECDFCARLWRQTRSDKAIKEQYLTKSRCIIKLLGLTGQRIGGSEQDKVTHLNLLYIYGYKVEDPRHSYWTTRNSLVFHGIHKDSRELQQKLMEGGDERFDDSLFGAARWRKNMCDVGLFRAWLRRCREEHGHPEPIFAIDEIITIRLIDVDRMCLVEFARPASELPEYAALSYVWGDAEQRVVLKKESLADFLVEDSEYLTRPLNHTIADAINLASRIGLVYIWIDALCIIQDSPEDKAVQIPQMHQIFSRAELTIVAAYGSNADAGLPGVAPESRGRNYFQMELPEITVLIRSAAKIFVAKDSLGIALGENYLLQSEYLNRAWTFQEGLLSKRVLVFTKDQVYFECDRCTWSEESHWESSEIDFKGWRAIKYPTPFDIWLDALDRRAYNPEDVAKDTTPRNSYGVLLKNYTQRDLRYDEDILDAFSGMLAMVKVWEKTDVFFGLRTRLFGNDLLFNMMSTSPLRFTEEGANRHASTKFPTWSWTSWYGAIQLANEARHTSHDPIEDLQPCDGVKCYKLTVDEEGNKSLQVINEDGGWRFKAGYHRTGGGIFDMLHMVDIGGHKGHDGDSDSDSDHEPDIPVYEQDLTLETISKHPVFDKLLPNFHIVFSTFSTLVVLRTECLPNDFPELPVVSTHSLNRSIHVLEKQNEGEENNKADEEETCSYCSGQVCSEPLPEGLKLGLGLGSPPHSGGSPWIDKSSFREDVDVPDGVYKLLWMNNNQLPNMGHLLCRPASRDVAVDGSDWEGEVLQRVTSFMGPTGILEREKQEALRATWGVHVLG